MRKRVFSLLLSTALVVSLFGIASLSPSSPAVSAAQEDQRVRYPFQDVTLSFEERAADLVSRMTLEEKLTQFGSNNAAIPRLGVAHYDYWTEGLHGVARLGPATSFPFSIGMAASWDEDLILQIATATADEARGYANGKNRGLNYFSPTINLYRDPRWGRSDECYSEDPFLTSMIGQQFVNGFQGTDERYEKVNATIKHYAANNSEFNRENGTSDMDNRTLLEYYTRAFKHIVMNTRVSSVMGAYNRVNGVPVSSNRYLLDTLLRKKWGFSGFVVSDCGAVMDIYREDRHYWKPTPADLEGIPNSSAYLKPDGHVTYPGGTALALLAGTDLNCGEAYGKYMREAYELGLVTDGDLDIALTRVFTSRFKTGEFDPPEMVPYRSEEYSYANQVENQAHKQLAEDAADQTIVLLKNTPAEGESNNILPLNPSQDKNIVVVGGLADDVTLGGYSGMPSEENCSTPLQGLEKVLGQSLTFIPTVDKGGYVCNTRNIVLKDSNGNALRTLVPTQSTEWHNCRLENNANIGFITAGAYVKYNQVDWNNVAQISIETSGLPDTIQGDIEFHIGSPTGPLVATITSTATGTWTNYQFFSGNTSNLNGVNKADLYVVFYGYGLSSEFTTEQQESIRNADTVIAYVGTVESDSAEGRDRDNLDLPRGQTALIKNLIRLNPRTVVFMQTISMVNVEPFKDEVPAILWSAYNGQAQGNAMARVIYGQANPSAKLPFTWYARESQLPAITDYSIRSSNTSLGRTYQYFKGDVSYPFGYGLSYTSFTYSNMTVSKTQVTPNDTITVTVDVKNTGSLAGAEVVQLYVVPPSADGVNRPLKQLKGFSKVQLAPNQTKTVTITLPIADLYFCDEETGRTVYDPGNYQLEIGASSQDIKFTRAITLSGQLDLALQAVYAAPGKVVLNTKDEASATLQAELTATLNDDTFLNLAGSGVTISYSSNNTKVATVDNSGKVTGLAPGVCTITASVTYKGVTMSDTFPVVVQGEVRYEEGTITEGDVSVTGQVPAGGSLYVEMVANDRKNMFVDIAYYFGLLNGGASQLFAYNVDMTWNYDNVPTLSPVTMRIKIPEGYEGNKIIAVDKKNGKCAMLTGTVADGYITFTGDCYKDAFVLATFDLAGDVNGNGRVDVTDARLALQWAVEKAWLNEMEFARADVNRDEQVTITDARLILQYAVGKISQLPPP